MTTKRHPRWYHALHALHFSFVGGLLYGAGALVLVGYIISPAWVHRAHANGYAVFAETSFWNTRIPRYPQQNPSSDALVAELVNQTQAAAPVYDTTDTAAPVYEVDATIPTTTVTPLNCTGSGEVAGLASQWQAVPIPFFAEPSEGATHRMVIYQSTTQTVWEFDGMQKIAGQWYACQGGRIDAINYASGIFNGGLGSTGSGLALLGGQVSVADLRRGSIGHAIGITLPTAGGISWPAVRSDGLGGHIPEGMRFQLDPNINIDSLGLSPVARLVAKTAQEYGFVVWGTASKVTITGENPKAYTARGLLDPYGSLGSTSLAGFPWQNLRALPHDYGRYGEIPEITSFQGTATPKSGELVTFSWSAHNVDGCTMPGLSGTLGASGTVTGPELRADTSYTLTCSGPGGSTSRGMAVSGGGRAESSPLPSVTATTIDVPLDGFATILPMLDTEWAKQAVQKVTYYEFDRFVAASTVPPFRLDTTKMPDGPHVFKLHVAFRDGHQEVHSVTLRVRNQQTPFVLPGPLAAETPRAFGRLMLSTALLGLTVVMITGFMFGWHRLYPRSPKPPLSWLVTYAR